MAQNLTFNLAVDTNTAVSSINQFFNTFDQGAAKAKNSLNQAFGQKLQTEVEINLKNGELVAKKIQSAHQESNRLGQAIKAVNGEFGKTPNELKKQIALLKQIQGNTAKYGAETKKVSTDWQKLSQRIKEAEGALKQMTVGGPLQQMQAGLTGIIGKFTLVQTLANLATSAVMGFGRGAAEFGQMASRMETLQLQLEGFTGGSEKAAATFKEFAEIAAKTPFNLEQVATAGKIMMAFGVDSQTAVEATNQLGIAAAATGGDVNLLARNLGQIAAQGQAYTRDLTQFAIQGIPIWAEMSEVTGKSVTELKAMAAAGEIGFDTVTQALTNLTQEGSAFAEIAERMQETFAGRMARIEASVNELALAFVNTFNKMDQALGGIVSGSMKLFADALTGVAKHLETIAKFAISATAAVAAFVVVSNFQTIVGFMQGLRLQWALLRMEIKSASVAQTIFNVLSGNWAPVIAALAIGAGAYLGLGAAIDGVNNKEKERLAKTLEQSRATGELTDRERERYEELKLASKEELENYDEAKKKMDEKKEALDKEIRVLEEMKKKVEERYDKDIEGIRRTLEADRERRDEMREAQQAEIDRVRERHDAALAAIDAEIGLLREKTGKEKELYAFQKQQLIEKIKSGNLDKEELLRAEARLSRMNREEQIQAKMAEKKQLQLDQEKEMEGIQNRHKQQGDEINQKIKDGEQALKDTIAARDEEIKRLQDVIDNAKNIGKEVDISTEAVEEQIIQVDRLAGEYNKAKGKVDEMAASLRIATAEQIKLNKAQAKAKDSVPKPFEKGGKPFSNEPTTSNFAGGPIAAGTTSWVNELGKEAFLSASGRLSMINAPAFGQWTAPTDGTIIPAHLTKQLNVPTGGINLNSAASSNAFRAGSGGMGSMVRAIQGAIGGDTFNQNVTVQAANPVQAANNVMVEMSRLKRRRFR